MTDNADLAALIRNIPDYPKPGIMFRDVSTLLLDGAGFRATIDRLAAIVSPDTELIAGIEARGFIVAAGLSYALGLGKLMLRKPGKLPGEKIGIDYELEYGADRIEMHVGHVKRAKKYCLLMILLRLVARHWLALTLSGKAAARWNRRFLSWICPTWAARKNYVPKIFGLSR